MKKECFSVEVSLERFVSTDDERARVNLWLRRGSGRLGFHWQRLARRLGLLIPGDHGCRRRIAALRAGALLHPRDPVEALLPGDIITLIPVPESWGGEWSGASDDEEPAAASTAGGRAQPARAAPSCRTVAEHRAASVPDSTHTRRATHSSPAAVVIPPTGFSSNPDLSPTPVSSSPALSCPPSSILSSVSPVPPADPGCDPLAVMGSGGDAVDGVSLAAMKRRALSLLAAVAPPQSCMPPLRPAPLVPSIPFVDHATVEPLARRRRLRRRRRRGSKTHMNAAGDNTHSISDCFEINSVQAPKSPSRGYDSDPPGEDRSASEAANETASDMACESTVGDTAVEAAGDVAGDAASDAADEAAAVAASKAAGAGPYVARVGVLRGVREGETRAPRRVAAL